MIWFIRRKSLKDGILRNAISFDSLIQGRPDPENHNTSKLKLNILILFKSMNHFSLKRELQPYDQERSASLTTKDISKQGTIHKINKFTNLSIPWCICIFRISQMNLMIQLTPLRSYLPRPRQTATRATSPTSWPMPRKLVELELIKRLLFSKCFEGFPSDQMIGWVDLDFGSSQAAGGPLL